MLGRPGYRGQSSKRMSEAYGPPGGSLLIREPCGLGRATAFRLDALGWAPHPELLHVLMLPDFERADRIGEFWSYPESRTFAELLIDYPTVS